MSTLYDIGVNKKAARLWFKLNEATDIRVKTSSGLTDASIVGDAIGQGALVSQLNLDHGLHEYFQGSCDEVYYGGVCSEYIAY